MKRKVIWEPNPGPQTYFLTATSREVLYGGAVGGGKTEALIQLPLYRMQNPKHQGIILRRESKYLRELIDRQKLIYPLVDPGARWYESKDKWYWQWSSGAKTWMGYAEHELDIEKFRSFEFDLIEFEELTEFTKYQYEYMFLRNRSKDGNLPAIIRAATNPGGEGMAWVFDRFIDEEKGHVPYKIEKIEVPWKNKNLSITRQFIPSTVYDNPKLPNKEEYIAGIAQTEGVLADAYLEGKWGKFRGQYFPKNPIEVPAVLADRNYYIIRCMDYGWGDPTCVMHLIVYPTLGFVDVASELYGAGMTTDSIAQMVQHTEKENGWTNKVIFSVLSPDIFKETERNNNQSIPTMLNEKGVWFTRANNDRVSGWARIALLISRGQLRMWQGRAPHLKRTLTKLPRDVNKPNDIKVKGTDDHAAECLRYGVMEFWDKMLEGALKAAEQQDLPIHGSMNRDPGVDSRGNFLPMTRPGDELGLPGWS